MINSPPTQPAGGCNEYRREMILAALRRRLEQEDLSDSERQRLLEDVRQLEEELGM